ncbi:dihydrofolate reductase family protein [Kutzneria buriramensis]|uniref:5-amino-6-(5-phosphoribosylamino)uracil reductase n=1 Tax=Kutzneria buriramensis TaxID=1045776 RepID=A0A3E0I6L3_9PSEU|nr:dihydrofolate reductase family protein [Kutzneria buriramensis]REH54251.1 5-amino-6-(5-phosphoribosylamino)uracil reductase [Kutzneria buriramensis]
MKLPYVVLSAAVSIDGCLDDAGCRRLLLSCPEDFDRVDAVRADVDAILVGANTIRRDNPRLIVHSEQLRQERLSRGLPAHPMKVVVTGSGDLDPELAVWSCGGRKLVFTVDSAAEKVTDRLGDRAEVVSTGPVFDWHKVLAGLGERGVDRLMVEGGGTVHTQLVALNLADELHVAVAPLVVGQADAPRFLGPANYPGGTTARMRLLGCTQVGDVVLLRYSPKDLTCCQ